MEKRHAAALVTLALCPFPSCQQTYDNPFDSTSAAVRIPAQAALVFSSDAYSPTPGAPREILSIDASGAGLTRLTTCRQAASGPCASLEAAVAPDRLRAVVRRVGRDTNADTRLDDADDASLVFVDFARGTEVGLLPADQRVTGVDWSPTEELLLASGAGESGLDDLFSITPKGTERVSRTTTPTTRDLRPRFHPLGTTVTYERIDENGKGLAYLLFAAQPKLTSGAPGTERLPGTRWIVGSDADPDFSPDGRSIAFRRLTGTGNGGLGTWDILTQRIGAETTVVASGPAYRSAPDWGPDGIVFAEVDKTADSLRLVVAEPAGSARRVLLTTSSSFTLEYPRWLQ